MTQKAMREKIAGASKVTCTYALLHKQNEGRTYEITKHQQNALRINWDGKPFWISLDKIAVIDDSTFATVGPQNCAYPGQILGHYRIEATA